MKDLLLNVLTTRKQWLQKLMDPRRDLAKECGHPDIITTDDYKQQFLRGDLASRIVSVYPEECWAGAPDIYETEDERVTEFEGVLHALIKDKLLLSYLQRADILSGIGRFGVLLLGIDDGKELSESVDAINDRGEKVGNAQHHLLYLRPFDESLVTVNALEQDITNPRYGMPTKYQIHFADTTLGTEDARSTSITRTVHWSRVIHIADNRTNSEVYGLPRMERVFNRLLDLQKVMGGSGEMFWKGGFPGYSLEATPGLEDSVEFDAEATKEQMESYMNGLQRYIATVGMSVKSLGIQIADPRPHVETQVRMISMALSVPWRILMGVEVGQLASEQDIEVWNRRLKRRREEYLTPFVIRPTVDRLIALGVLPEPVEYSVSWKDLNSPKDEDKATVAEKRTNALSKYVAGGVDTLVPPFHYLTLVLGMTDEEASSIIDAAESQQLQDADSREQADDGATPLEDAAQAAPQDRTAN